MARTMINLLLGLSSFIPHGHCYLWKPGLVGLHITSDWLIALAYYSIPLILIYFVRKRQDIPYPSVFLLFSAFIIACGTMHLIDIWTLWHPTYWFSGSIKALTAGISVYTAMRLIALLPQALELPSPAQLTAANQDLEREIAERQRIEGMLRQQAERERLLGTITQHIHQSLDLEEILNTTVEEVQQLLQVDRVVVYRFQPNWNGKIIAESVSSSDFAISGETIYDPCFATHWQEPYRQGRISAIEDIYTHNIQSCHIDLLKRLKVRANLVLPILHEEKLWGLLVAHHCSAPRYWQTWEIDLLRQLMTPVNIAIQQSYLHQQVQQLNSQLEQQVQERTTQLQQSLEFEALLKRITDKVRDSLDENQILQTAVQELALGLKVDCCDVGLYDADKTTCSICNEYHTASQSRWGDGFNLADTAASNVHKQLFQGVISQFCLVTQEQEQAMQAQPITHEQPQIEQPEFAILTCPLVDNESILGNLRLFKSRARAFNEPEIRLAQQVANQCTIAVRQARLYQTAQGQVLELERLNRLKDDFLSTVSHELRTPMSNIKMAIQILEMELQPLGMMNEESGAVSRYFQILQDESEREIELINDLLDLSRLDAETEPLALATVDLKLWIPYVVEPFEVRTHNQQQQLDIKIPANLPLLTTDLAYFERLLTELLNNACKYTPPHETIAIAAWAEANRLHLSVSNTGVEIPTYELSRIFDKFYRIPSHDPWKHGGTGLGLALVKKLSERLGGTIDVESHSSRVTFMLELPVAIAASAKSK